MRENRKLTCTYIKEICILFLAENIYYRKDSTHVNCLLIYRSTAVVQIRVKVFGLYLQKL